MLLITFIVLWDVISKIEGERVFHMVNHLNSESPGRENSCLYKKGFKKRGVLQFEGFDFTKLPRKHEDDDIQLGTVDALGELLEEIKIKTEKAPQLAVKDNEMGLEVSNIKGNLKEFERMKVTPCNDLRERFFRIFPENTCLLAHNSTGKESDSINCENVPQSASPGKEYSENPGMEPQKTVDNAREDKLQEPRNPITQIFSTECSLCIPIHLLGNNKYFSSESSGENLLASMPQENLTAKESTCAKCQKGSNIDSVKSVSDLQSATTSSGNANTSSSNCASTSPLPNCKTSTTSTAISECTTTTTTCTSKCGSTTFSEMVSNCSTMPSTPRNSCMSSSTETCIDLKTSTIPCNATVSTCSSTGSVTVPNTTISSNGTCNNTTPFCVTPSTCKFIEKFRKKIGALFSRGPPLDHLAPSIMDLQRLSLKLLEQGQAIKDFVQTPFKPECLKTKLDDFRQTVCQMRNITQELEQRNASCIKISLRDKSINDTDRATTYFTFN